MRTKTNVVELRQVLAAQFPHLRPPAGNSAPHHQSTGLATLDSLLGGGLPCGQMTELVGNGAGSGSAQILGRLVEQVAEEGRFLTLVDGADSFDPGALEPESLARLLWVRCSTTTDALKATDLLLRDQNHSVLVLDLKLNPTRDLRQISSSIWFRYKRLLEKNGTTFLIVTPFPLVSGASARVEFQSGLGLQALKTSRSELYAELRFFPGQSTKGQRHTAQAG